MIVAGIGCRRLCNPDEIVALVQAAQRQVGCHVEALAIPAFKAEEPGLREAASQLGTKLLVVDTAALERAQARCPAQSPTVQEATGFGSIAEACALAAAGANSVLLLPKIAAGRATCALAAGDPP